MRATQAPETIRVFQQHQIDFCCGGRIPLSQACSTHQLDLEALITELQQVATPTTDEPTWNDATLARIIAHIQTRYHEQLRVELPRIGAMVDKVVSRHGDRLPQTLLPLQQSFSTLHDGLIDHMEKKDRVLFPFIVGIEAGTPLPVTDAAAWIAGPISIMEADHDEAGSALATLRRLTDGYAPPEWACPHVPRPVPRARDARDRYAPARPLSRTTSCSRGQCSWPAAHTEVDPG